MSTLAVVPLNAAEYPQATQVLCCMSVVCCAGPLCRTVCTVTGGQAQGAHQPVAARGGVRAVGSVGVTVLYWPLHAIWDSRQSHDACRAPVSLSYRMPLYRSLRRLCKACVLGPSIPFVPAVRCPAELPLRTDPHRSILVCLHRMRLCCALVLAVH